LNLKQTFPLKRYKDFDSFFLTLRVNLYTKTNISTRNICLLLLGWRDALLLVTVLSGPEPHRRVVLTAEGIHPPALAKAVT